MIYLLIGLVVLIILSLFFVMNVYNTLSKFRVRIQEAWSGIDVQLKRRVDLIPNLVETVKGYAQHEKEVFENVSKARAALMGAMEQGDAHAADEANNALSQTLKSLFAVSEAYPELKASENFTKLQDELTDTENKIAYSRQFLNTVVREYNTRRILFPTVFVANMFGFKEEQYFKVEESDKEPVKVDFNTQNQNDPEK